MNLYIEDDREFFVAHEGLEDQVKLVIQEVLKVEQVPHPVEISLTVVDKEEIQEINKTHREIDRATDVLSFPQIDPVANGDMDWAHLELMHYMNLDTKDIMLGDIVLCDDIAREQAESYNHSLTREVCFLVAHSMFHLLGYDHMNEVDEKLMMDKQNQVLDQLGITR